MDFKPQLKRPFPTQEWSNPGFGLQDNVIFALRK